MEWKKRILALGLTAVLLTGGVTVLAAVGTSDNPLVTLGYLKEGFTKAILSQTEEKIQNAQDTYEKKLDEKIAAAGKQENGSTTGAYAVVELSAGQTFFPQIGGEIMLRSGGATTTGGLLDTTAGTPLDGGALTENHLYMVTASSQSVKADSSVTLLVRGGYTVR